MNQTFSRKEVLRYLRNDDLINHGISKTQLENELDRIEERIAQGRFRFNIRRANKFFILDNLGHRLVQRKLNDNIKRIYKDKQSNRNLIIEQLKTLLGETCPFHILRTDIKGFYESVNREYLLEKFKNDTMLSYHSIFLVNKLFSHLELRNTSGLPRGMNLSSTLSEIYLRNIDKWVLRNPNVYYYARFVDDIVIFIFNTEYMDTLIDELKTKLKDINLELNQKKTGVFDGNKIDSNTPLQYLGYKFWTHFESTKTKVLHISIAEKKIKKIRTRIVKSFLSFISDDNIDLLIKRIKFLTGNYIIKTGEDCSDLKAGNYYNYPHLNNVELLKKLDNFYRKFISCKRKPLNQKINQRLSTAEKSALIKYSFYYGYKHRICYKFEFAEINQIQSCWQ